MPEARKSILDSLARRKATIKLSHDTEIVASLGSEARTRLLGGMWIDRRNFPRQVAVSLGQSVIGTKVDLIVTDKMGFGSRVGMRDKFRLVMKEDAEWIRSGFLDAKSD